MDNIIKRGSRVIIFILLLVPQVDPDILYDLSLLKWLTILVLYVQISEYRLLTGMDVGVFFNAWISNLSLNTRHDNSYISYYYIKIWIYDEIKRNKD